MLLLLGVLAGPLGCTIHLGVDHDHHEENNYDNRESHDQHHVPNDQGEDHDD